MRTSRAFCLTLLLAGAPVVAFASRPGRPPPRPNTRIRIRARGVDEPQRPLGVRVRRRGRGIGNLVWRRAAVRQAIIVPFAFESTKSGIGDTTFHPGCGTGATSLSRRLERRRVCCTSARWTTARWSGSTGSRPARTKAGTRRSAFDVTDLLKAGANTLVVRAEDPPTDRYIPRGKQYWEAKSAASSTRARPASGRRCGSRRRRQLPLDVRITPAIDGAVRFDARLARRPPGRCCTRSVSFAGTKSRAAKSLADGGRATLVWR